MKQLKKYFHLVIFYILIFTPVVVSIISLVFLPNKIPVHSNYNGEIDRYGSKYEILILPLVILIFGAIFYFWAKHSSGKSKVILIWGANLAELIFNVITYILIAQGFNMKDNYFPTISQIAFTILGLVFILIGIVLMFVNKLKNLNIKGQRILFISNIAIGFSLILINFFPIALKFINIISILLIGIYVFVALIFVVKNNYRKGE